MVADIVHTGRLMTFGHTQTHTHTHKEYIILDAGDIHRSRKCHSEQHHRLATGTRRGFLLDCPWFRTRAPLFVACGHEPGDVGWFDHSSLRPPFYNSSTPNVLALTVGADNLRGLVLVFGEEKDRGPAHARGTSVVEYEVRFLNDSPSHTAGVLGTILAAGDESCPFRLGVLPLTVLHGLGLPVPGAVRHNTPFRGGFVYIAASGCLLSLGRGMDGWDLCAAQPCNQNPA